MELTGKAKELFFKFYFKTNDLDNIQDFEFEEFNYLSDVQKYALIIEWFDSIGIFISLNYVSFFDEIRNDNGFEGYVTRGWLSTKFRAVETRQESTKQAIIKANEIYNSL